jgi:Ca2+-transporting ATPase
MLTRHSCRRLDNEFNIFEGMWRNMWFLGIQLIIIGGQVLIIFIGGQAFAVTRLNGPQWGVSLVLGVISLPIAIIIRLIPDEFIRRLIPPFWRHKKSGPQVFVSDEDRQFEWNPALEEIRDQLTFLKTVRGGRLKHLRQRLQHPETLLPRSRSGSQSRDESTPQTPNGEPETSSPPPATPESRSRNRTRSRSNSAFGPAAAMAGVIAGSIAGWSPIERNHHDDSQSWNLSSTSAHSGLDRQQGLVIHPGTREDDPIIGEYDLSSSTPPSQNPDLVPVFEHAPPDRTPSRGRRSMSRRSRSNTSHSHQSQA